MNNLTASEIGIIRAALRNYHGKTEKSRLSLIDKFGAEARLEGSNRKLATIERLLRLFDQMQEEKGEEVYGQEH